MADHLDTDRLKARINSFPSAYNRVFDDFWRYKSAVEGQGGALLDGSHFARTAERLMEALRSFQAYRPVPYVEWSRRFTPALMRARGALTEIQSYSLLELDRVDKDCLKTIWAELGRVKDVSHSLLGWTYVVGIGKPLMFLWGQSPRFDSKNRVEMGSELSMALLSNYCGFEEWYSLFCLIGSRLAVSPECIGIMKRVSAKRYGGFARVPYGRFVDMYYWS